MVPRLRFKDENGQEFPDLVVTSLGSVSIVNMGQSPDSKSYNKNKDGIPLIQGNADIQNRMTKPRQFTSSPTKKCIPNDIIMTVRAPVGYVSLSKHHACIGRGVCSISSTQHSEIKFLYQLLLNKEDQWYKLEQGSTFTAVSGKDINNLKITIPGVKEQQKIASFLSSVDEKISKLEKKKTLLETYKRGIMQKIFSQELRFKDENGQEFPEWKEDVLGNIFDHKKGTGLSGKELDKDGEFPCILYGALYTKYDEVIKNVIEFSNIPGKVKSISGDLLVPASTTTSGIDLANFTALNQDGVSLGGDITIMRNKDKGDNSFWAYYLTHFHKKGIAKYAQGTTIVHLYFSHFKHLVVKYPSFKEQQKIASFLSSIDKKIEITSTQLEKTREFKKGLLQQMFV